MKRKRNVKHVVLSTGVALTVSACSFTRPAGTSTIPSTPVAILATPSASPQATRTPRPTSTPRPTPEPVAERLKRAAVMVRVYGSDVPSETSLLGTGSGFVTRINGKLVVITAAHVTAGATSITVVQGGSTHERAATLRGDAACSDLAVLEVSDLDGLEPVELGTSGNLHINDQVSVAGFPLNNTLGAPMTLTSGEVSIDGTTTFRFWEHVTQYTAPTNPGASGAMVVNETSGEVVAIHVAGIGEGMNYGIAIDAALPTLQDLARGERQDWLGTATEAVTLSNGESVLTVDTVTADSPLGKAGVVPGDMLVLLDGKPIHNHEDLCNVLRDHPDGVTVDMGLLRPGDGTRDELVGRVTFSKPDGENWVQPLTAVRVLNMNPEQVGQEQAKLAQARQGLQLGVFETFSNAETRRNFLDIPLAHFQGGVYELTVDRPNLLLSTLWQQRDRPDVHASVPRDPGDVYIIEADVAFKTFDSTSGVGIVVDQQANSDGTAFLINRDNTFQILTWVNGKVSRRYSSQRVPWSAMRGDVNTLRVVRTPKGSKFWINNAPVAVLSENPFPGGGVGVGVFGDAELVSPAKAIVDNVRIEMP